jgi:sugar transferase (PEP-CTERM system associated)
LRRVFLVPVESLLLWMCGLVAAYIRYADDPSWEIFNKHGWLKLCLVAATVQLSFYVFDLYDFRRSHRTGETLLNLAKAITVATLLLFVLFYLVPALLIGRGVFLLSILLGAVCSAICRIVLSWGARHPKLGRSERVLVLGSGRLAIDVAKATLERRTSGFQIVGFVDDNPELLGKSLINPSVIGLTEDIEEVVERHRIDRIVVAVEDRRGKFPVRELLNLSLSGRVAIEESACYYERLTGKINTEMLRPSWLIFSRGGRFSSTQRRIRGVLNFVTAALGLVLSLPVMLLVAIAVRLDSPGPVFYVQERVGENDKKFKIIKFRSMGNRAEEASGPVWASQSDPRVTRVGRIIRKLRLDEIPQFINVLRGDMNFVGPRPERPEFVEELSKMIPYYSQRHLVKPGLTGWAQVRFPYGASVEDAMEKLQYDLYYIKNQSWLLDGIIVFETFKIVLFGRGGR